MKFVESLSQCCVIVLCGPQGAGKTLAYRLIYKALGGTRIDGKRLNHAQQMIFARYALISGNLLIIDDINPTKTIRQSWIKLAREYNASVGLLYIDIEMPLAAQRAVQCAMQKGISIQDATEMVNRLHHTFYAQLEVPDDEEGFDHRVTLHEVIGF